MQGKKRREKKKKKERKTPRPRTKQECVGRGRK